MDTLVITLIGPDRTGIVETIAAVVREHEGNWMESRLARLGGQFAGIVHVLVDAGSADALVSDLEAAAAKADLALTIEREPEDDFDPGRVIHLELAGPDRPGIVAEVAGALAEAGVNVLEMETGVRSAPMSGEPLFEASAQLAIGDANVEALADRLDEIAGRLGLDVHLVGEIGATRGG